MAKVPAGATLLDSGDKWFSLVVIENVYIFPGIPEALRKKFEAASDALQWRPLSCSSGCMSRAARARSSETLNALLEAFPDLVLGSYPKLREASFKVLLTLESRDEDYVQRALDRLLADLPETQYTRWSDWTPPRATRCSSSTPTCIPCGWSRASGSWLSR